MRAVLSVVTFLALACLASAAPRLRLQPGINITVSPSTISGSGGSVLVTWTGVPFATSDDWVGMWCPVPSDWTQTNAAKFVAVTVAAPDTYREGRGSFSFYAVNVRGDCIFQYMTGGAEYDEVLAVSDPLVFQQPNYPTGIHLAVTGNPTEMRVSWASSSSSAAVKFGTQSGSYTSTVKANSSTYGRSDMCGDTASSYGFINPGSLNTAVLTGLDPTVRYYYIVGDLAESSDDWSEEASFVQPAQPGDNVTTHIIAFGDMGNADADGAYQHSWDNNDRGEISALNTTRTIQNELARSTPPSLILHIGDISYAVGFGAEWDQFMHQIEPIAKTTPWMTSIGNHEYDTPDTFITGTDSGGECGVPYAARFIMPAPADSGRPDRPWYGFAHGLVYIIQMSTEHDFRTGSEQNQFIEAQLKAVDRSVTPWVVFTGHRPMYIDSEYDEPVADMLREHIEPLLVQYKVDVGLWGHNHSYMRMCQMVAGKCTSGAPKHWVIGMAGYSLTNASSKKPSYMEFLNDTKWGVSRITVTRSTFKLEFIANGEKDSVDEYTLHKQ